jgi:hypothetical protein
MEQSTKVGSAKAGVTGRTPGKKKMPSDLTQAIHHNNDHHPHGLDKYFQVLPLVENFLNETDPQLKKENRGLNFFDDNDLKIIRILTRGEFNIYGFRNKDLRKFMTDKSTGQVSRILKRMKLHGIIKRAANSYKYYLTKMGKEVTTTALKIKEFVIIPALNY